jgi:hypothetical protein
VEGWEGAVQRAAEKKARPRPLLRILEVTLFMVVRQGQWMEAAIVHPLGSARRTACYIPRMSDLSRPAPRATRLARLVWLAALPTLLAACAGSTRYGSPTVELLKPFDQDQALHQLRDGPNTLTGTALLLHRYGGASTCAGKQVALIPATAYADERMTALYGVAREGVVWPPGPRFEPDSLAYEAASRTGTCGVGGAFRFDNVADGAFYVVAIVPWEPHPGTSRLASLAQRVDIKGGKPQTIELKFRP